MPMDRASTKQQIDAFARKLRGRRGEIVIESRDVSGLFARVAASGEVTYAVRYRDAGGQSRTITLSDADERIGLAEARDRAKDVRAQARSARIGKSVDPWAARQAAKAAVEEERRAVGRTVERIVGAYLESDTVKAWKPETRYTNERLLRRHWVATIGRKDANEVQRRDVREVLNRLKDTPSEQRHAFVALSGLYSWARSEPQDDLGVTTDPLAGMKVTAARRRDKTYIEDEVRAIFAALPGTGVEDFVALLFHTGTRDSETRAMRWRDVNWDRALWTIPADVSKSGATHVVCLSTGALEVLRRRPRFGEWVFTGRSGGSAARPNSKVLGGIGAAARLEGGALRLHDVRRTVGDSIKLQHGEAVMHGALGHTDAMLTRTYGPTPRLHVLAEAMEWWAGELRRILGAKVEEGRA